MPTACGHPSAYALQPAMLMDRTSTPRTRVGVVGTGVFGRHHARKYQSLPNVELVGVYDRDPAQARHVAGELDVPCFASLKELLGHAEAVSVAAPAVAHFEVAAAALQAGRHVYVEKPLASDLRSARALATKAEERGRVLAVGHQERAVFDAMGLLAAPERPISMEAVRRNTHTGRNEDVSVVLDLMIHDLDLAVSLAGASEAERVDGTCWAARGVFSDHTEAEILFSNGATAHFVADRAAPARERTMRLVYPSGEVRIDFLARTFDSTTAFPLNAAFAETEAGRDPLGASIASFIAAVRGEASRPLVTGKEAALALDLAFRIERSSGERRARPSAGPAVAALSAS